MRVTSLRGDLVQKWRQRVTLADAGLSEQAAEELRSLQRKIGEVLGAGIRFNPSQVVADPAELLASVQRVQLLIEARDGLKGNYNRLLLIPRAFFWGLLAADAGMVTLFVSISGIWSSKWLGWVVLVVCFLAAMVLGIALVLYRQSQERLADADILSSSPGSGT